MAEPDDWGGIPIEGADDFGGIPIVEAAPPKAVVAAAEPPDDHGLADRRKLSLLEKAANPITSYLPTQKKMAKEGIETLGHGIHQMASPEGAWDFAKGVGNTALGALEYVGSPINAAYRTVVGQPVEDVTGIPREYTEFGAQLVTPGLGLTRLSPKVPGAVLKPSEIQPSVASRAAVPEAESANELGIPLSRGQATRDLDAIRYEDMASRGAYGPKAQEEAARFFDEQFKAIQTAGADVGETLGRAGPTVGDTGEAATVVNSELLSTAEKARAVVAEAERRAAAEVAAHEASVANAGRTLDETVRSGRAPVQGAREAGEAVGQGVRDAANEARQEYKGLYKEAFDLPGEFGVGTFTDIGQSLKHKLTNSEAPVIIDDTTKVASRALDDLDKIQNLKFENRVHPKGSELPEGSEIVAVNLKGVDQARKLLVARYQQAKSQARATQDFSDLRAMERVIDAFDDHIEQAISNGLFSGDERALSALQEARASFSNYRKTYRPNPGDDVSAALNRIVTRNATPEEIGNMIVGSGKIGNAGLPVRLADKLKEIFGADSDQWSAVRQSIWQRASNVRSATGELDAAKAAKSIDDFSNTTLARKVFDQRELSAMRSHASGLRDLERVIETLPAAQRSERARSIYQQAFGGTDIGGSQATVFRRIMDGTATPQETTQAILGAVNSSSSGNVVRAIKAIEKITGPESDTMSAIRQGVWQKLTKNAAGKDQPGQQKVAQAINEFLNGQGKMVAQQLYSPDELALMKKYADAIKLTVIPPRAATRSDTAVGLMAVLHKYSGAIASAIGGVFGHGPVGALTGYGVGKLLEKGSDSIKEMKELNRIRSQFEPPSAARILPARSPSISLPPATAPVLSNPPRTPLLQSPSTAGADEDQNKIPRPPAQQHNGGQVNQVHGYADGGAPEDDVLMPPPRNPADPPRMVSDAIASGIKHNLDWASVPGRVVSGVEPETPGQWSEEDEFRKQHLAQTSHEWGPQTAFSEVFWPRTGTNVGGSGFSVGSGATLPKATPHQEWANEFRDWSSRHAFGPSTVSADAVRHHALERNPIVKDAAADLRLAKDAVAKYEMADPSKGYVPTPPEVMDQFNAAAARLRKALADAREAAGVGRGYKAKGFAKGGVVDHDATPDGVAIDTGHDVRCGAVASKKLDGPVYIDRRIPEYSPHLKNRDGTPAHLRKYLAVHETKERAEMARLIAEFRQQHGRAPHAKELSAIYNQAHTKVATPAERSAVEADGVSWGDYTHEMNGYLSSIEHERVKNPPHDTHVDPDQAIGHHAKTRAEGGAVEDDPFERAAYRVRQAARPEGGRQEGALSEALSDPAFLFNASPLGPAREALYAINEGEYGRAAAVAAPLAVPMAGPAIRGVGALVRAAPRTAATFAGITALGVPSATEPAIAESVEPKGDEWWRTPREPFRHPEFVPPTLTTEEREPLTQSSFVAPEPPARPSLEGLGPMARKETQARYDTRLAQAATAAEDARKAHAARQAKLDEAAATLLERKAAKAREDWERERDAAMGAHAEEQSRLDKRDLEFRLANQSFTEAHPNASLALPAAGAVVAGAIPYGGRMMARGANNAVARQLEEAAARARLAVGADAATRAAARGEVKAALGPAGMGRIKDEHPSARSNATAMVSGGLGSAEASLIPYEIDRLLPEGSHGRHESDDYKNWLQRGAFGSLGGILGSRYGMEAPLLRGRVTPPVAEMEGLLTGLKTPKTAAPRAKAEPKPRPSRRKKTENDDNVVPLWEAGMATGGAAMVRDYLARAHGGSVHRTLPSGLYPGQGFSGQEMECEAAQGRGASENRSTGGSVAARAYGNTVLARANGGRVDASNIDHSPSPAQAAAGNYKHDHIRAHGLDITVENARGSTRRGVGADGKPWSCRLSMAYGYIKRTTGADSDHLDVYLGPHVKSPRVYVIDQINPDTGKWDEHKAIIGLGSEKQAREFYARCFSDGKGHARIGRIHEMAMERFKSWLNGGDTTKPFFHVIPESEKRDHASVGYVPTATDKDHCAVCVHYIPGVPPACEGVKRPISPTGWCRRFGQK